MRRRKQLSRCFFLPYKPAPLSFFSSLVLTAAAFWLPAASFAAQDAPAARPPAETTDSVYTNQGPAKSTEIGNFYFKRRRYKAALSRFEEAADTDHNYAPAYLGMGRACEKLGLNQKALESYRKYLEMLPSDKDAENARDVQRAIERLSRGARSR